ncbi:collagenase-like protease [Psychromonas sp. psych-6C06]|uniref:peptidase U32 family protein n=1 Tax=Psychromonas sp. psych-6C06 TaxID=2058089 RepID=UPI000C341B01|nr:peptidase U32 family protein [Psychromonas sp. psych-6C06]PKF61112.1 collagenase-like protease [Psychromonas sp. psych-6C06]
MTRKIELLAPGGDVDAIKAAIVAGANAIYCGLDMFNARNRATNISFEQLKGILRLAHRFECEVFLTVNVVILEHEIKGVVKLLNQLVNTTIDGIIVQDLGLFNLVKKHFPTLLIHASTQLTTHNAGQIEFLAKAGATRVNLSREMNLPEVKMLTTVAHDHDVLTEVFVHGALCIAFSGQCYSSSVSVGNSGNRGRCSQACRDEYEITDAGNKFPLNLKDNSAYFDLPELVDAGVDSLKIEGRIKGAQYVHTVVDSWRQQINQFVETGKLLDDNSNLYKVFNRDFTNSFLKGNLTKDMFIDNPRDNSFQHANEEHGAISVVQIQEVQTELSAQKNAISATVADKIKHISIEKPILTMAVTGQLGKPLSITIAFEEQQHTVHSQSNLIAAGEASIQPEAIEKRFKSFKNGDFELQNIDFSGLNEGLSVPFKELTTIKNEIAFLLNGKVKPIAPVELPALEVFEKVSTQPTLSLLISDVKDSYLAEKTEGDIYFKLPESWKKRCNKHIDIFLENPRLIPWFPAVLIGKDYDESVRLLETVKPKRIISNNTGIALKATQLGIEWIAGPLLNTTNSYALLTLQEELNCAGAFISNEINRNQIRNIKRPKNFKMLYSIYHPILMMTSRQCFFQQTVGCNKPSIEDGCMLKCQKATTITNVKGFSFAVDKQLGGYPSIYNDEQFLNLDVVEEFSALFDEFFIDLTNIGAGSKAELDKAMLLDYFTALVKGDKSMKQKLDDVVSLSTHAQYIQGL